MLPSQVQIACVVLGLGVCATYCDTETVNTPSYSNRDRVLQRLAVDTRASSERVSSGDGSFCNISRGLWKLL